MKKGVVLLVTLFFIMAITILILANLSDTKNYLDKKSLKFTKIQMLYYVNNIKNEILKEIKNMIDKSMTYKTLSEEILKLGNKRLFLIAEKEIKDNKGNVISKKNDLWRPVIFSTVIIHDDEKNVSVRFNPDIEYLFWQMSL